MLSPPDRPPAPWFQLLTTACFAVALGLPNVRAQQLPPQAGSPQPAPQRPTPAPAKSEAGLEPKRQEEVLVEGRTTALTGIASSATQGAVGREELQRRPLLRPGELLETVPGIIVTQHTGAGKGNQFFLRGFNLDHGTDLAVRVAGIPNNLPSHGHGQGYLDINYLIPELVDTVEFRKGTYYADAGDFASAGSVAIRYVDELPSALFQLEGGSFEFQRTLFADSFEVGDGTLLFATELQHEDGPWSTPQNFNKFNGILRYTTGDESSGFRATGIGYDSSWIATDHIAKRAVDRGQIGRWDSLDPTSGGDTHRFSLSGEWWGELSDEARWNLLAYGYSYDLDLFSNFTYGLNDPVNGDQFLQRDERLVAGVEGEIEFSSDFGPAFAESRVGFQFRNDVIENGLFHASARRVTSTVRDDDIVQTSLGVYFDSEVYFSDWLRGQFGVRGDVYAFDVDSNNHVNSGSETDAILSPKAGLTFGPWADTEFYVQGGFGFHSNDARGTTIVDDPTTAAPNDGTRVTPLVRQKGAEFGIRNTAIPGLQSTLSAWYLESDSELLFVGDAGNTEPTGATERYGVEWANFWEIEEWLTLDLDLAASNARFTNAGADDHVPGAIDTVAAFGATLRAEEGHYLAVRGRYFGPRKLTEDGTIESSDSLLVNAHAGWRFSENWQIRLSVFNLFDREVSDIEYFYPSRLIGEPGGPDDGGFNDIHFHPSEPFAIRLGFIARF